MTHEQSAFWLAGIFDGEGCVATYRLSRRLFIANTDKALIDKVAQALETLGIKYTITSVPKRKPHHKDQWLVNVMGQENLILFYNWVPFQSEAKVRRLYEAIITYKRPHPSVRIYTTPDGVEID